MGAGQHGTGQMLGPRQKGGKPGRLALGVGPEG